MRIPAVAHEDYQPTVRMVALRQGTVVGQIGMIHVNPKHSQERHRAPWVSEAEAELLERKKLARPATDEDVFEDDEDQEDLGLVIENKPAKPRARRAAKGKDGTAKGKGGKPRAAAKAPAEPEAAPGADAAGEGGDGSDDADAGPVPGRPAIGPGAAAQA